MQVQCLAVPGLHVYLECTPLHKATVLLLHSDAEPGTAIVLAEDKKYYPTADEVYGQETETLVMEEDAQPLEVPIIAPVVSKKMEKLLDAPLATHYSNEFLATLSTNPELIRNVAVSTWGRLKGLRHRSWGTWCSLVREWQFKPSSGTVACQPLSVVDSQHMCT